MRTLKYTYIEIPLANSSSSGSKRSGAATVNDFKYIFRLAYVGLNRDNIYYYWKQQRGAEIKKNRSRFHVRIKRRFDLIFLRIGFFFFFLQLQLWKQSRPNVYDDPR